MILLSPHFTLEEFVRSDVATRKGINNDPPADVLENLKLLAEALERVRAFLDRPLHISSGYRGPELNAAIGGSKTSAHMSGRAADWTCPGFGTPSKVVAVLAANRGHFTFDQIILEFPNALNGGWVHYGIAEPGATPRGEILVFDGGRYERYAA